MPARPIASNYLRNERWAATEESGMTGPIRKKHCCELKFTHSAKKPLGRPPPGLEPAE